MAKVPHSRGNYSIPVHRIVQWFEDPIDSLSFAIDLVCARRPMSYMESRAALFRGLESDEERKRLADLVGIPLL